MTSDPNWQTPVAVLQTEMKHITEQLEDIKASQAQMATSMRRMEDVLTRVGGVRLALYAVLPTFGVIVGIKYQSVMSWFGFK
jgi:hypothetical protein